MPLTRVLDHKSGRVDYIRRFVCILLTNVLGINSFEIQTHDQFRCQQNCLVTFCKVVYYSLEIQRGGGGL